MAKIKVQQEWEDQDIKDFLSDFAGVKDENTIHERSVEVAQEYRDKGFQSYVALMVAMGYEKALLDIYNNTKC